MLPVERQLNSNGMFKLQVSVWMRIKYLLLPALFFIMVPSFAQRAIIPGGGNGSGTGGSMSYSIGQLFYTSTSDGSDQLFHGVQQPYEISMVSGWERYPEISLAFSAYPNPVSDILILNVGSFIRKDLKFKMYNSEGKVLFWDNLLAEETNINVNHLVSGIYFLAVFVENSSVKTFRIIKK